MKIENKKIFPTVLFGIVAVLAAALLTAQLAPDTWFGNLLELFGPLLTGILSGVWIYLKFKGGSRVN